MTGYIHGARHLPDADRLAAQLIRERQRADYWERIAKAPSSHTRRRTPPLTNAAGEIEPPLPTTETEQE